MNFSEDILKNDEKVAFRLRSLYKKRGYEPYKMSKFEEYDLYVRNKSFLVSDNIITFTDTDGKLMALKPDVTLSIIKSTRDGEQRKLYYNENVYRVSGGTHSYKEIMQTGLECIGKIDLYSVSEVLSLAVQSLAEISEDFVLDISHLGIISQLLDLSGACGKTRTEIIECIGKKNVSGLEAVCADAGISAENTEKFKVLIKYYGRPEEVLSKMKSSFFDSEILSQLDILEKVISLVGTEGVRLDFSTVGDMNYYNGIIFKGYVNSIPSAVLSGGQYDALMRRFSLSSGAIGFAVYTDMIEEFSAVPEYDVDTLVLYTEKSDPADVLKTVELHIEKGESVRALQNIPEKLKYKNLVKIGEE